MLSVRAVAFLIVLALVGGAYGVASNYERSVTNVLKSEGETYENHPNDPGGPTKFGVTIKDVRLYVKKNATAEDVKALTKAQALTIYHDKYWEHACVRADALPAGLDYSIFDYGVNAGVGRAGKILRQVLGVATDSCTVTDGLVRLLAKKDAIKVIRAISAERRGFYTRLIAARPSLGVFRRGWMARVDGVESVSLRMAGAPPKIGLFGEEIEPQAAYGPGKAWLVPVR